VESVWRKYLDVPRNGTQNKSKELGNGAQLDTVVVGGGIAGIMCAYMLSKSGHRVTLIEAHKILEGVTSGTTAKLTALQGNYQNIPTAKKRRMYYQSQIEAVEGIASLGIDCDFKRVDSFVYGERKQIKKEYKAMRKFATVEYFENEKLPFGVYDCIKLENQAQFNPIKFCYGLLGRFDVIEDCRIKKVSLLRKQLKTEDKIFKYNRLVIATGFPIVNIRGLYSFKMFKSSSYAVCVKAEQKVGALFNAIADDGLMYRDCEDGVIVDGFGHRTGKWKGCDYFEKLRLEGRKFGGGVGIATSPTAPRNDMAWAANDCMTFDSVPYAGRLLRLFARDVYVISGFGKWGMANSYASAKIVDDLVNKRKNRYRRLFKPTRVLNVMVWPKVFWNFLQDGWGLVAGLFSSSKRRCPHMGCRLKFNPNTKTYDCPCHGSRFTDKGDIIVSPAVDGLTTSP